MMMTKMTAQSDPIQPKGWVDVTQCQRMTVVIVAKTREDFPLEMRVLELTRSPQGEWPSLTDILEGKVAS